MKTKKPEKLKFKRIRFIEVEGVRYKIIWKNKKFTKNGRTLHHRAETESPIYEKPCIRIAPSAWDTEISLLQVLIDEIFHSFRSLDSISNEFVDEFSDTLASFLFETGFRLSHKNLDSSSNSNLK